jgi:hypothetical protein
MPSDPDMPLFASHPVEYSRNARKHRRRSYLLVLLFSAALAHAQPDGRQELALTSAEADYVRAGMREHVVDVQALLAGLANHDLDGAKRAAHSAGTRSLDGDPTRPPTLGPKLPAAWKAMLQARMRGFDQVAQDIDSTAETARTLRDLSTAMATCVACHATFKLVVVAP